MHDRRAPQAMNRTVKPDRVIDDADTLGAPFGFNDDAPDLIFSGVANAVCGSDESLQAIESA
jgi:hypothetical protein